MMILVLHFHTTKRVTDKTKMKEIWVVVVKFEYNIFAIYCAQLKYYIRKKLSRAPTHSWGLETKLKRVLKQAH